MTIVLKDDESIYQRARRLAPQEREEVNAQINKWTEEGIVHHGHFEFLKVLFYLCCFPAVFQKFINAVLKDLIEEGIVLTYMDDLIVPSNDYESGLEKLKRVFIVASENGLIVNWKKCAFLENRVEFLGHIVENGRVYLSQRKIEAVKKFSKPTNVRQIQRFLGLTGYFRKFVPGYSTVAGSL